MQEIKQQLENIKQNNIDKECNVCIWSGTEKRWIKNVTVIEVGDEIANFYLKEIIKDEQGMIVLINTVYKIIPIKFIGTIKIIAKSDTPVIEKTREEKLNSLTRAYKIDIKSKEEKKEDEKGSNS